MLQHRRSTCLLSVPTLLFCALLLLSTHALAQSASLSSSSGAAAASTAAALSSSNSSTNVSSSSSGAAASSSSVSNSSSVPFSNASSSSSSSSSSGGFNSTINVSNATLPSNATNWSNISSSSSSSSSASWPSSSTGAAGKPTWLPWNTSVFAGSQDVGVQNIPFSVVCSAAPWSARYGHAVVASGSTVLLLGGISYWDSSSSPRAPRDIWRSSDLAASWTLLTAQAPFGVRQGPTAVLVNGAILLIGGETLLGETTSDVWSTSDLGLSWTRVCPSCFPGRHFHTSSVDMTSGTIVLTSGLSLAVPGQQRSGPRNDVYTSTNSGKSWKLASARAEFEPRWGATSFWRSGVVYVMGGMKIEQESGEVKPANDLWYSENFGKSWEAVLESLPRGVGPRAFMVSAAFAGSIYVAAGCTGSECVQRGGRDTTYGDLWRSDDEGRTWAWQESTAAFGPRAGAASVQSGGSWLLVGGVNKGWVMADVHRAELPQGNPNSDGGVVGGILGAATGCIIAVLIARHCLISWREKQAEKRARAHHSVPQDMLDPQAGASAQHVHIQLTEPEHGGGRH